MTTKVFKAGGEPATDLPGGGSGAEGRGGDELPPFPQPPPRHVFPSPKASRVEVTIVKALSRPAEPEHPALVRALEVDGLLSACP